FLDDYVMAACKNDQDDLLSELLQQTDVNINHCDTAGNTPAHYTTGDTPLHKAVQYTEDADVAMAMVDVLLQADADPRLMNKAKETPSMVADTTNQDIMDLLEQAMAIECTVGDESHTTLLSYSMT
ncbi:hypothetical protein BDF14DRAFT_1737239, partial [Spinellus fusiger]